MTKEELRQKALDFHKMNGKPGKVSVIPTKPCNTGDELSLAYTPGVAQPCLEIKDKPETVWEYTSRGNMVAVVSDGTAVLGLGNIGPEAGLPVMEGKAVLFKHFADIDAVPICLGKVFNEKGSTPFRSAWARCSTKRAARMPRRSSPRRNASNPRSVASTLKTSPHPPASKSRRR